MSELTRSDYLRIKWPILALLVSIAFAGTLFAGLRALDERAARDLRTARSAFDNAQEKVDDIAEEEASIRANIVQFQQIAKDHLIEGEDRLQMREHFALLRSMYALFPISLQIGEQTVIPIQYGELDGKKVDDPGRPISLEVSNISFSLPLLHENDFVNLMNYMMAQPELLQPLSCDLKSTDGREPNYLRLSQHFNASCLMTWYTFHIDDSAAAEVSRK